MATAKRPRTSKKSSKTETEKGVALSDVAKITTQAVNIHDKIRIRAFELFMQRGCQHGRDFEDWLRAESEVLTHFGARSA